MSMSPSARHKARHYVMQALYQWQLSGNSINTIEAEFHADNNMAKVDTEYFHEVLHGVPSHVDEIETDFSPHLNSMTADQLDPITRALLRLAGYEFRYRMDVPYRVVINEAVNLAKKFGATDSHKFINGVLDKVAAQVRSVEVKADSPS